jgi:hypothetical protein
VTTGEIQKRLIGSWHLVSWEWKDADGAVTSPLGADPAGLLVYDSSGCVSAQLMRRNLPLFRDDDWRQATDEEKACAWSGYFGYFGRYRVDEEAGTVTHLVEGSWFPNLVGTVQVREFAFEGARLWLSAQTAWGRVRIVWEPASKT